MTSHAPLDVAWARACEGLGVAADAQLLADVTARYEEPHRRYHTRRHLEDVVAEVAVMESLCDDAPATMMAAFFHDAVYRIGEPDNEAASAALAVETLASLGVGEQRLSRIATLIEVTTDHRAPQDGELAADAAVLIDADLAVLARPPQEYQRYVEAVREEYADIPDDLWRIGRAHVLDNLLRRDRIYLTPPPQPREPRARQNLQRERDSLD